ncbi:exported hypothetical protein [Candidatus Terasakiella magnetica]|uniref:Uncharacterized protein n=1 Tax=Candidatus Terasakiella magnetica TaxID=1867952 RepID=A0A1C3REP8_9PROT|nr:transporter substrate-binding domain-containing protein [Candidatus Terasakiella magnetica]SCA55725.1 exported hypothetical protein [Candidatus Terasakiella magnetica]
MKSFCCLLALMVLLLCTGNVRAHDPIKIGIFDFPPFYSKSLHTGAEGILADYARQAMAKVGFTPKFKAFHTPVLMEKLREGEVDVAMLIRHPALTDKVLYSKKIIAQINLVSYRGEKAEPVKTLEDLAGKRILSLAGYGYGGILNKLKELPAPPKFIEINDIYSGLEMLSAGRGDYFLSYLQPSQEIAKRKGYLQAGTWLVSDPISTFDVYWVVSAKAANAKRILARLESLQN